jgi:hypothetical protein
VHQPGLPSARKRTANINAGVPIPVHERMVSDAQQQRVEREEPETVKTSRCLSKNMIKGKKKAGS